MAQTTDRLWNKSDNLLRLNAVKNVQTGAYIDDADSAELSLYEETGKVQIDEAAASDLSGGEVKITITAHPFVNNDYVFILGTKNYNDEHQITVVDADNIKITATFVAETFTEDSTAHKYVPNARAIEMTYKAAVNLLAVAAVDNGDTTVEIPSTLHGFSVGDVVTIAGTDNYNGTYVIQTVDENSFSITATFVAETFAVTDTVTARGIYEGIIPETANALIVGKFYYMYIVVTKGFSVLTLRKKWKAAYYPGASE